MIAYEILVPSDSAPVHSGYFGKYSLKYTRDSFPPSLYVHFEDYFSLS